MNQRRADRKPKDRTSVVATSRSNHAFVLRQARPKFARGAGFQRVRPDSDYPWTITCVSSKFAWLAEKVNSSRRPDIAARAVSQSSGCADVALQRAEY
jgi:hypothetical protein